MDAFVDDIRVYSRAISHQEVQILSSAWNDLIVYYPLDTDFADVSGVGVSQPLTLNGANGLTSPGIRGAQRFVYNGANSLGLDVPYLQSKLTTEVTMSFFIFLEFGNVSPLGHVDSTSGSSWLKDSNGQTIINFFRTSAATPYFIAREADLNGFNLLTIVNGPTEGYRVYVNGVLWMYSEYTGLAVDHGYIGQDLNGNYASGEIDEIKIWKRAWTAAEVMHYALQMTPLQHLTFDGPTLDADYGLYHSTNTVNGAPAAASSTKARGAQSVFFDRYGVPAQSIYTNAASNGIYAWSRGMQGTVSFWLKRLNANEPDFSQSDGYNCYGAFGGDRAHMSNGGLSHYYSSVDDHYSALLRGTERVAYTPLHTDVTTWSLLTTTSGSNSRWRQYQDSLIAHKAAYDSCFPSNCVLFMIGAYNEAQSPSPTADAGAFNGFIDDYRFYSRVLQPQEVRQLYGDRGILDNDPQETRHLVVFYTFDNAGSPYADSTTAARHATLVGTTSHVTHVVPSGSERVILGTGYICMDGTANNYLQMPDMSASFTTVATFNGWFKHTGSGRSAFVSITAGAGASGSGWLDSSTNNTVWDMFYEDGTAQTWALAHGEDLADWNMFTVVVSPEYAYQIYINGRLAIGFAAPASVLHFGYWRIGWGFNDGASNPLAATGCFDDIRLYDIALTADDIVAMYWSKLRQQVKLIVGTKSATIRSNPVNTASLVVTMPTCDQSEPLTRDLTFTGLFNSAFKPNGFTYLIPVIASVNPSSGISSAARSITILGASLNPGSDVTSVMICDASATITAQTATSVTVTAPTCAAGNTVIQVNSTTYGSGVFTWNYVSASITSITPNNGPAGGGQVVTIFGANMMFDDFISATICGNALSVTSQNRSVIIGTTSASSSGLCSVAVTGAAWGTVSTASLYTYNTVPVITSTTPTVTPATLQRPVTIIGTTLNNGVDVTAVSVCGVSAVVLGQTPTNVTILVPARSAGACTITISSYYYGVSTTSITYVAPAILTSVVPAAGPAIGGNTLTITATNVGSGSDITSVTFCGRDAPITGQSANTVTVTASTTGVTPGTSCTLQTESYSRGIMTVPNAYLFHLQGTVTSTTPVSGPVAGGFRVTIVAADFTTGSDLLSVKFGTTSASSIVGYTTTAIIVVAPAKPASTVTITVQSTEYGFSQGGSFTFNPPGNITYAVPDISRYSGGLQITIFADVTIGSGSDITSVTLNGAAATIVSQTALSVVVIAGDGRGHVGLGSIVTRSTSFGIATRPFGYRYRVVPIISDISPNLGNQNGGTFVNITGTNFGNGTDITSVILIDNSVQIVSQGSNWVYVRSPGGPVGTGVVNVTSDTFGTATFVNGFTYAELGVITHVNPSVGPSQGGNIITISGGVGSGTDIFSVTIATVSAVIVTQSAGAVVITVPPGTPGLADVEVESKLAGVSARPNGYQYNVEGTITSIEPRLGPRAGTTVTVVGTNIGNNDITAASIFSTAAIVSSQTTTSAVLQLPAAPQPSGGVGPITLSSIAFGDTTATTADFFTYNPSGAIVAVVPSTSPLSGSIVTIFGTNLCASDVYGLSMAGINVTTVISQLRGNIVVRTAASPVAMSGDVIVQSVSFGTTTLVSGFRYIPELVTTLSASAVTERGTAQTMTVNLNSQPSVDVIVEFSTNARCRTNVAQLTFTSGNWNTPQTVSVAAMTDFKVTGTQKCNLVLQSSSADLLFHALTATPVLNFLDTDVASVNITRGTFSALSALSLGGYFITEGETKLLDVVLTSIPNDTVIVTCGTLTSPRIVLNPMSLTFTAATWNITQQLSVLALTNNAVDPTALQWVSSSVQPLTSDGNYRRAVTSVDLLLLDADIPNAVQLVSSNTLHNISESGRDTAFFLLLTKHVTSPIPVTTSISDTSVARVSPTSFSIADADYLKPLAFVVTPYDDFIAQGDVLFLITAQADIGGIISTSTVSLYRNDNDTAGFVSSRTALSVNETGASDFAQFYLTSQPSAAVTVTCGSSNTSIVTAAIIGTNTIQPSAWRLPVTVSVSGIRDDAHVNRTAVLTCTTTSADGAYSGRSVAIPVTNFDVFWPVVRSALPTAFALLGSRGNITGAEFLPGIRGFINGTEVINMQFVNSERIQFTSPIINVTGYHPLLLLNRDGGFGTYPTLYFTLVCPNEGDFGAGTDCRNCSVNATCPGGYRMWPNAGFWTDSEFSGYIQACSPASRCLGGQFSSCAVGYTGNLCAQCARNYYSQGVECLQCSDDNQTTGLLFAQFAFTILVFVCILSIPDARLNDVQFVLGCLRTLWVVSVDGSVGLPTVIGQVYSIFDLFAGDISFVRPGCSGINSFNQIFAINVSVLLGLTVPIVGILYLKYRYLVWRELGTGNDFGVKEQEQVTKCTPFSICLRAILVLYAPVVPVSIRSIKYLPLTFPFCLD
eukprot:TRINITY_DN8189_c0_g1_i1.p1 TRINITY_DN8189_c0_g1~~TRINITY_DN8189_c0_g1_i1.p1  ORF type:complete len:2451 (-),score=514.06 TRINITY_DN8189_c0_g1_i1:1163-8401(-)